MTYRHFVCAWHRLGISSLAGYVTTEPVHWPVSEIAALLRGRSRVDLLIARGVVIAQLFPRRCWVREQFFDYVWVLGGLEDGVGG